LGPRLKFPPGEFGKVSPRKGLGPGIAPGEIAPKGKIAPGKIAGPKIGRVPPGKIVAPQGVARREVFPEPDFGPRPRVPEPFKPSPTGSPYPKSGTPVLKGGRPPWSYPQLNVPG